jgi:hypothetical protein
MFVCWDKKGLNFGTVETMEFRNSIATTGVNIPQEMVGYVLAQVPVKM